MNENYARELMELHTFRGLAAAIASATYRSSRGYRATLFQDRDFPVLNDYRSVLGGLFEGMYGVSADQLDAVFKGVPAAKFGLV